MPDRGIRRYFPKGGFRNFISRYFPTGIFRFEGLRNVFSFPTTIIVPPEISKYFAWDTGLNVPYVDRPRIHFKKFLENTLSQEQRLGDVKRFYNALKKNNIWWNIFSIYKAKGFLSYQSNLDDKHEGIQEIYRRGGWSIYILVNDRNRL